MHRKKNREDVSMRMPNPRVTLLASIESLSIPLVQEVVFLADYQCTKCQQRVAEIMIQLLETKAILVSVVEKKVTLTCEYSNEQASICRRFIFLMHFFHSSCTT
ncbi:uncharacterized protein LOC107869705 [Capsicum annuum]|uniref:uncharacterized protein LOC107869705 n=1 Tax=Capsicum annuum TaxID=4072 RepID=UPI0007BF0B75|nr:uncharacterized protein LOC107869705 [Capsicum annuum]